jgi:hypothetical protein
MKWDNVLSAMIVGCALITTGLVARRELVTPATEGSMARKPVLVSNWKSQAAQGVTCLSPIDKFL